MPVPTVKESLLFDYPWIRFPVVAGAPMRLISLPRLAVEVTQAGGIGFIAAGNDTSDLDRHLLEAHELLTHYPALETRFDTFPVGIGFLVWGADLEHAARVCEEYLPCAVWLFAARSLRDMHVWAERIREATEGATKIWVQVSTVAAAVALSMMMDPPPEVFVVQGQDAGGHALSRCASVVSLVPEVVEALDRVVTNKELLPAVLAAGGIVDARGAAACVTLGAAGVALGTRLLASPEADIANGYRQEIIRVSDGGVYTDRNGIYDKLRGTSEWPPGYAARGVVNQSWRDALTGMSWEENKRLYEEALTMGDEGWGLKGRLTTYAGSAVGLVKEVKPAGEIVREVIDGVQGVLSRAQIWLQTPTGF